MLFSRSSSAFHVRLWIIFAVTWSGIIGGNTLLLIRERSLYAEWYREAEALDIRAERVLGPVYQCRSPLLAERPFRQWTWTSPKPALWKELVCTIENAIAEVPRRISREQVEKLLDASAPLELRKPTPDESARFQNPAKTLVASFTDPTEDLTFLLRFENGIFAGHELIRPSYASFTSPVWLERARSTGCMVAGYRWHFWVALLLLLPFLGRRRHVGAELLLMVAVSTLIMTLPAPMNLSQWQQVHRNPVLPWSLMLICASLAVLFWVHFAVQDRSRIRCPVCDYNLAGNVSGVCSECGAAVPAEIRKRLATRLDRSAPDTGLPLPVRSLPKPVRRWPEGLRGGAG